MPELFIASVQYDDLKGSLALDGHDGPPLRELAKRSVMPAGYFPVGFSLFRLHPDDDGMIPFQMVAVRCDQVGTSMDEIVKFAREHDEVPVYSFSGKLNPADFPALFKRVDIKALTKNLAGFKVMTYSSP